MTSAADILDFLQLRRRLSPSLRQRPAGEFPPGWQSWLESMPARSGAVTGAPAGEIVSIVGARPLAAPLAAGADLTRWQAFATLWRQGWHPPEPEERRWRWLAAAVTAVWHLVVSVMLVWLMYLQYLQLATRPAGEEQVVEVQFLGEGTPGEVGGGKSPPAAAAAAVDEQPERRPDSAAPSQQPASQQSATPQPVAAQVAPPALKAELPEISERDIPEPQLPPPPAEQPVAVSKPVDPEPADFVLPPTRRVADVEASLPDLDVPDAAVPLRDVAEPLQPRNLQVTPRPTEAAPLPSKPLAVREREISTPVTAPAITAMQPAAINVKPLPARNAAVREVSVPEPVRPAPAASPSAAVTNPAPTDPSVAATHPPAAAAPASQPARPAAAAPSPATPGASVATSPTAKPSPAPGTAVSRDTGAGPRPTPAPGAAASAKRADDWGDALQQRPGAPAAGKPGLYNSDGSVRIAEAPGSASPGAPPGTLSDEITDLDRAGTWLKRKPVGYQPTRLDKFWMPHETLLDEWVRKGIKQVSIRIPGTSKRVVCVVSLLQLGGGCGISDPNLNEQPATARPPPDIPFKPHLQEDNGSVRPAQGG